MGSFTLLPNHIAYVTALCPGIVIYEGLVGERYAAIELVRSHARR